MQGPTGHQSRRGALEYDPPWCHGRKLDASCDQNRGGTDEWASSLTKEGTPYDLGREYPCAANCRPIRSYASGSGAARCRGRRRSGCTCRRLRRSAPCRESRAPLRLRTRAVSMSELVTLLPSTADFAGDVKKCTQLGIDRRGCSGSRLTCSTRSTSSVELDGGGGAVAIAAEVAFVRADTNAAIISRSPLLRLFGPAAGPPPARALAPLSRVGTQRVRRFRGPRRATQCVASRPR